MTDRFPLLKKTVEGHIFPINPKDEHTQMTSRVGEIVVGYLDRPDAELDTLLTATFVAFQAGRIQDDIDDIANDCGSDVARIIDDLQTALVSKSSDGIGKDARQILVGLAIFQLEKLKKDNAFEEIFEEWDELPALMKKQVRLSFKAAGDAQKQEAQKFEDYKAGLEAPRLAALLDEKAQELVAFTEDLRKRVEALDARPPAAGKKPALK